MAWRRTGVKPLSETMIAWFTDAYLRFLILAVILNQDTFSSTYIKAASH